MACEIWVKLPPKSPLTQTIHTTMIEAVVTGPDIGVGEGICIETYPDNTTISWAEGKGPTEVCLVTETGKDEPLVTPIEAIGGVTRVNIVDGQELVINNMVRLPAVRRVVHIPTTRLV